VRSLGGAAHVGQFRTTCVSTLAGLFALAQTMTAAHVYAAEADRWGGWAEIGGFLGGNAEDRAEAAVFLPVVQTDKGLFFADVRGKLFEEQVSEINAALGYRQMLESGWNLGVWLGADRRDTSEDNIFWAASGGIEALSENVDVRLNGYLAISDPKGAPGLALARIEGGQVFLVGGQEVPLSGIDGEVGLRLPVEVIGINAQRHGLRAYVGGFHFDDKDALANVSGPKARIEWRVDDVIAALPGSRLALETEIRSDEVRGGHVEAGLRFRLPFAIFDGSASRASDKPVQWRRMTDGLERDTDIVTTRSEREPVEDALTGVDFDRVVNVDAASGVTTPAATAGGNTLLVADGAGGVINGAQVLQANQTLVGGAGTIQVRGLRTGTVANLTAPGQRPTFDNATNADNFIVADRTHIAGAAITGRTLNFFNNGVFLGADQFVVLQDLDIANIGGVGVFGFDRNTVQLLDVNVSNTPVGPGFALRNDNTISVVGGSYDGGAFGFVFNDRNSVSISGVSISNPAVDGINMDSNNVITIANSTISSTGIDGIAFNGGNTLTINDSVFVNIGVDALFGNDSNTIVVSGSTVAGAGDDFIDLDSSNVVTVTNSMATGLGGRAFIINDGNMVTVTGGQYSSQAEAFDADDGNTIFLTDTSLSSLGAQEGVDISDGNTLVMSGTSVTVNGNRALEFTNGNNVSVNLSVLNGTPTNTVAYDGTGNVVSGTGNVDNTAPTVAFCSNAGVQTGTISFTNGNSCP